MEYPESFTLTANITAMDIKKGCKRDAENCPAARAITRVLKKKFPGCDAAVGVGLNTCSVCFVDKRDGQDKYPVKGVWFSSLLSVPLSAFVDRFDNEQSVEPLKVSLTFDSRAPFDYDH